MALIVFDIDGTIADCTHRLHYIEKKPKNWNVFFSSAKNDLPILPMVDLLMQLADNNRSEFIANTIVLATGRPEYLRNDTTEWIRKHIGHGYIDRIYMRGNTDYRSDDVVKVELAQRIEKDYNSKIWMWFDDRERVIQALRNELGIFVIDVAQVRDES